MGGSHFGSVSRSNRWYWSARASVVASALRIMPCSLEGAANHLKLHLLGFLIGRFAGWPIMIHIPLPLALTLQIVGSDLPDDRAADDESGTYVGAGPAQSISFDHVSDHPS